MQNANPPLLIDGHQREVRYLRVSITDRCNLRCRYCRVDSSFIPHNAVLRYEELMRLINLAVGMGIKKVRLTGGEPFVRQGFADFLTRLRQAHPDIHLRVTSNGVMLAPHAPLLAELKVNVNLSLDSLNPERFAAITGRDALAKVMASVEAMRQCGVRFKINAVAMKGFNDDELPAFLDFAVNRGVDVRFIEFMPMGGSTIWSDQHYWPATDILEAARSVRHLTPVDSDPYLDGPAQMYAIRGGQGRFGLITPLSNHFCGTCNRLRITSDGKLRTCLFDDREYALTPLLRHPRLTDKHLERVLRQATMQKPIGAHILAHRSATAVAARPMTSIGG